MPIADHYAVIIIMIIIINIVFVVALTKFNDNPLLQ